jgi:hypothetical protein
MVAGEEELLVMAAGGIWLTGQVLVCYSFQTRWNYILCDNENWKDEELGLERDCHHPVVNHQPCLSLYSLLPSRNPLLFPLKQQQPATEA